MQQVAHIQTKMQYFVVILTADNFSASTRRSRIENKATKRASNRYYNFHQIMDGKWTVEYTVLEAPNV